MQPLFRCSCLFRWDWKAGRDGAWCRRSALARVTRGHSQRPHGDRVPDTDMALGSFLGERRVTHAFSAGVNPYLLSEPSWVRNVALTITSSLRVNETPSFLPNLGLSDFTWTSTTSCFHWWKPGEEPMKECCFVYLLNSSVPPEAFQGWLFHAVLASGLYFLRWVVMRTRHLGIAPNCGLFLESIPRLQFGFNVAL